MQHTRMNSPKVSSLVQNSPTSSSSLRKSINASSTNILENDDEAERISRRCVQATSSVASSSDPCKKRHSLSSSFLANIPSSKMTECVNECIKLSTENKINAKNAFNLELIDYMTYMIKKQDVNMSSLQVASTSLDVSSKIYGFRVDSVHTKLLKIIGGLDKQTTDEAEARSDENGRVMDEDTEDKEEPKKKRKKKQNRQKIITTAEALAGSVQVVKPMLIKIGESDQQTSDMLSLASLPNHAASGFYLHPYNDVLVDLEDISELQNDTNMKYNDICIEDFSNLEICPSYSNFEFLNWTMDNEPEEMEVEEVKDNDGDNRFQFDLNASVEHADDDPAPEPMNYFDIEHDDENKENYVHRCHQKLGNRPNENIKTVQASKRTSNVASEYTFVQPSLSMHWAGPSHWKFRNFARMSATADKVIACKQSQLRKRKQIELLYHNDEKIDAKIVPSNCNKLPRAAKMSWTTEAITLPEDVHYDVGLLYKLYLHERTSMNTKDTGNKNDDAIDLNISDNERYDYNNPNDTMEYCPDVNNGNYDESGAEDCNLENDVVNTQGFIGENLVVAPKLANKIPITYCVRPKKIDMRQLKKSMWICLNSESDSVDEVREEDNEVTTMKTSKHLSDVYKILPRVLTKSNAEALSAPMAFFSLLHLANEKGLNLQSTSDMSDLVISAENEETK